MNLHLRKTYFTAIAAGTALVVVISGSSAYGQAALSPEARIALGQESPVVVSIVESNPTTAEKLVPAILTMLNYERPDLARSYAVRLSQIEMDQDAMADLGEKLGSPPLLQLITDDRVNQVVGEFARNVMDAVIARTRNAERLASLAENVKAPGGFARTQAIEDLRAAGPDAVEPLVKVLADSAQAGAHPQVRDALVQLGDQTIQPLLAALTTSDPQLKTEILLTLARLQSRRALHPMLAHAIDDGAPPELQNAAQLGVRNLLGSVPSKDQATSFLYQRAKEYLDGRVRIPSDLADQTIYWRWRDSEQKLLRDTVDVEALAAVQAARIMEQLLAGAQLPPVSSLSQLTPTQRAIARMSTLSSLQAHKLVVGLDNPVDESVERAYVINAEALPTLTFDLTEDVLELALDRDYIPAAIAAAEMLGVMAANTGGNSYLLVRRGPERSPLTRAAAHPDRRVRFMATQAILALQPEQIFAGASLVPDALKYFANVRGARRVLVAEPRSGRSQLVVGLLNENGYETDRRAFGRDAVLAAARSPEYEAMLISYNIGRPAIRRVLHELRKDPRTANLPVGIIFELEDRLEAEIVAERFEPALAFVVPRDPSTLQTRMDRLVERAGRSFVPHEVRMQHAAASLQALAMIVEDEASPFRLSGLETIAETALYQPQLSPIAAQILGNVASPAAQRALVEFASQPRTSVADRRAAVAAFAAAIRRRGIGLTAEQIQSQAELYDKLADVDAASEEVLWSILDVIQTRGEPQQQQQPEES